MARIDLQTVDSIQLYAPHVLKVDWKIIKGKLLSGEVFSHFNRSERVSIWENLRWQDTCDGIILYLYNFSRDISYLEVCANIVKRLVALKKQHPTVRLALVHSFRPGPDDINCLTRTPDTFFADRCLAMNNFLRHTGNFNVCYAELPGHGQDDPKPLKGQPDPYKVRAKADQGVSYRMADLSRKLVFRNAQIRTILQQSPDRQIARAALLKARKPELYPMIVKPSILWSSRLLVYLLTLIRIQARQRLPPLAKG